VALPKVIGTEVEYGIAVRNSPDFNPVMGSSNLINSYAGERARIQWSFDEESPGRDARGFGYEGALPSELDSGLVNVVLTNGARLYVDHAHPEYSTPECADPKEAALHDKAGELVMARAVAAVRAGMPPEERMYIHKNNSDGKGNSYGAHENYLIARDIPFASVVRHMIGFFVTRQIYTGSGKIGSENGRPDVDFQITQRADFFEEDVGLETTLKRPIINTRDEPHADPTKYRRLHVIIGDATRAEPQTFLKIGATSLILDALEDGFLTEPILLASPVPAVSAVSHDPLLQSVIDLEDGRAITALEAQWQYLEWARKYVEGGAENPVYPEVLALWETILTDLEIDPRRTADRLDWTAKLVLFEGYISRDGLAWNDPKLRLLNLQYHDIDPEKGLYDRLVAAGRMQRLFTDEEVQGAVDHPPARTRAYFRGRCVEKYRDALVAANWDSLVFDVGGEALKRVPMMEPLRGSEELVGDLIDECASAAELLETLGGE